MADDDVKEKVKEISPAWEPAAIISDKLNLRRRSVNNVIKLLDDGATIPFIARYRKELTEDMGPDLLRDVANNLEELRTVEAKIGNVYNAIKKMGKMNNILETSLKFSTSILEVESLYAPFKPGHKGTYAERAKALGLEPLAQKILDGKAVNLNSAVDTSKAGLESVKDVEKGVKHIIADIVSKHKELIDEARRIFKSSKITLESTKAKAKVEKEKKTKKGNSGTPKKGSTTKAQAIQEKSINKFEQYFDFKIPVGQAKAHQILALNRGEDLKIISVKISIPDIVKTKFINFALDKQIRNTMNQENSTILRSAVVDAYDRLIEPMLSRQMRAELTKDAEKASISVFTSNLKRLLLTPPVKNKTILGIDPGFTNGCKIAVISPTGQILETGVMYLHTKRDKKEEMRIASLVHNYRCEIITIGNGVACRETEQIISNMIKYGSFKPHSVVYCIVDECGASIYSVSDEAKKEMPDLDPTLRGAVSIARRLQDPLAELVKIEPKHLGVGMYQHDLNKTKLQNALSSVVEECVSFVGVDLNTCSESLLRRVAGLNATKANKILDWRSQHGQFTNRQQLLTIKGLGQKGYEQCAGFVRIMHFQTTGATRLVDVKEEIKVEEETGTKKGRKRKADSTAGPSKGKKAKVSVNENWNPLDATSVHPESYDLTHLLARHLNVNLCDIGSKEFMTKVKERATDYCLKDFCDKNSAGFATVRLIADALQQPLSYDLRESFQKPLFKQEIQSVNDLHPGVELTGRVTNVTHFGAFVDIGVGINGLVHTSKMGCHGPVGVGDHVLVSVQNIDIGKQRIGLLLKGFALK
ncbi:unnamed protein product [Lymnaea stagnalis]|uniref:S1 motif domain-containing protein n=1 Tax=Lymnaea stagnalis TaxID=6523 RepID=A0AAV2H432_LYMST